MNFELSEEQKMLKKSARDFFERECSERFVRAMEKDDEGFSRELWHKITELGWLGMVFPERYGGTGRSILELTMLYEEMGRAMFPSPHLSTVVLCGLTILAAGSEKQRAEYLPKIAKGDLILALALNEPDSSWGDKAWEPEGVTVPATVEGDHYIINGTKLFVHDAHIADYLLCVTRTNGGKVPETGITLFLVDTKSPGISYVPLKIRGGRKQSQVVFDKVIVPKKNMVGKLNGGWAPLVKVMEHGAVMACAMMVGAGEKVLDVAVDYAKTRVQFDMPIGINQWVQEYCIQALAAVDGSRNVTHQAAWRLSENLSCDFEVAVAKAWTSDAFETAGWCAHNVLAGVGYTYDAGLLPLYTARGKTWQLYLGDSAYWRKKVAKTMDRWTFEKFKGAPLGLWEFEQIPVPGERDYSRPRLA
jgi:alkylation response protein AidB-like acyl-CoA dehydrogenase